MDRLKNNKLGFSAVETMIIIVIVLLLSLVGWLVYKNYHKTSPSGATTASTKPITKTTTPKTTQAINPYSGWKSATLQYELITYQYPPDWTVTDNSMAEPKSQNDCTYPGHDQITLNSPSATQVAINAGQDCFGDAGSQSFGSIPMTSLGESLYLVFEGDTGPSTPTNSSYACLAPTATPDSPFVFKSKNIFYNGDGAAANAPVNSFCYTPYDPSLYQNTSAPTFTVTQIENSKDFATAKLILESLHY